MRPRRNTTALALGVLVALAAATALWPAPGPARADGELVVQMAVGSHHTCAVTEAGGVKCWGVNEFAALGDGTQDHSSVPTDVCRQYDVAMEGCVEPLSGAVALTVGGYSHGCAVIDAGGVACWGLNVHGELGTGVFDEECEDFFFGGTIVCNLTAVDVPGLTGVVALASGFVHTCALMDTGGVKCWGDNKMGQVGFRTDQTCSLGFPCSPTPGDVPGLESGVAAIAAGWFHTCALVETGGVKCWGVNDFAKLGATSADTCFDVFGRETSCSYTPLDVCQEEDPVTMACIVPLSGAAALGVGTHHSCVVTDAGGVRCWGSNFNAELGNGSEGGQHPRPGPVCQEYDPVAQNCVEELTSIAPVITGGFGHACALTTAGGVKCWGTNFTGNLGTGIREYQVRTTPVDVCLTYDDAAGRCDTLLSGVTRLAEGDFIDNCAVTEEGAALCWGSNTTDQLGTETTDLCFENDWPCAAAPVAVTGLGPKPAPTPTLTATPSPTITPTGATATATPTATGGVTPAASPSPSATPLGGQIAPDITLPETGGGGPTAGRGRWGLVVALTAAALAAAGLAFAGGAARRLRKEGAP